MEKPTTTTWNVWLRTLSLGGCTVWHRWVVNVTMRIHRKERHGETEQNREGHTGAHLKMQEGSGRESCFYFGNWKRKHFSPGASLWNVASRHLGSSSVKSFLTSSFHNHHRKEKKARCLKIATFWYLSQLSEETHTQRHIFFCKIVNIK